LSSDQGFVIVNQEKPGASARVLVHEKAPVQLLAAQGAAKKGNAQ
jgi:hypothetical protein